MIPVFRGDDPLTTDTDIKQIVRERYAFAAVAKTSCCGPRTCGDTPGPDLGLNMIGDAYRDVEGYLADADLGLGCGLPTQHAGIKAGDVVLDIWAPARGSTPSSSGASLARPDASSALT